jgi:PBP1b-binding outer membrane lipoprotein LpoB
MNMKKVVGIVLVASFMITGCMGPKPYYKTAEGKKKQKYYNDIQFGGKSAATMHKTF